MRYGGSDPHFADSLTGLGLTLDGFKMIGEKVKELSDNLCKGRSIDLICSGYDPNILAKVWLTFIASLSGEILDFEEIHPNVKNMGFRETKELIEKVKDNLKPYWKFT